ncbi:hypothetical protein BRC91_03490 [Halobacteriales archaeon QS_4_62_28]|nr:MAG: hypothetical protein BRC91_03490 [Halobacteriales archaeon QS_4_62_28]
MKREYPSNWDSRRKKVYRRDGYTCQNCGAKGGPKGNTELHAHHIVPKSKGGTHETSNLQTVCSECHNAIHEDSIAPTGQYRSGDSTEDEASSLLVFGIVIGTLLVALFADNWGFLGFLAGVLLLFILTVALTIVWSAVAD